MRTTSYTRVASQHIASMPRSACIVAAGKFGDSYCLLKNRDRNYLPKVKIVHEVRDGVEVAYMVDDSTGWVEGLNEFGVGIVNAALMVSRDESERDEVERTGKKLNDGERILKALGEKTLQAAAKSVRTYKDGLKGHTLISDGKKTLYVEMPDSNDVEYDEVPADKLFVRTNHGVEFPDAGYVSGKNEKSSKSRQEQAEEVLAEVESPDDVAPALLRAREDRWEPTEMVRDNKSARKMRTTSQMVLDLTERKLTFYVLPGRLDFEGVEDKLPKEHKPKLTVDVRVYDDLSEDTDGKTKKKAHGTPKLVANPGRYDHVIHLPGGLDAPTWDSVVYDVGQALRWVFDHKVVSVDATREFSRWTTNLLVDSGRMPQFGAAHHVQRILNLLRESQTWPEREGDTEQGYKVGPLSITNLSGDSRFGATPFGDVLRKMLGRIATVFPGLRIPHVTVHLVTGSGWQEFDAGVHQAGYIQVLTGGGPAHTLTTVIHEIGHAIYDNGFLHRQSWIDFHKRAFTTKGYRVTLYAKTSAEEHFCEALATVLTGTTTGWVKDAIVQAVSVGTIHPRLTGIMAQRVAAQFARGLRSNPNTNLSKDTGGKTKKRSKEAGLLPILDPAFNIREIFKQLVLLEDHLFHPRKRCPDCIWKHLLTCEAFAEEAVTLDLDRKHTDILDGLAERIRGLYRAVQAKTPFEEIAQQAREIRKGLLPVASMVRVARTDILDPALLEKNRKEVLLLAKAAESVRTLKNIPVLRKAVQKWTEAFERFGSSIREDLEGRVREAKAYEETGHRSKRPLSDKDWAQWYLDNMKPYWQLTTELWGVPEVPELKGEWGGKWEEPEVIRDRLREHFKEQYPADQVETQIEAYMDRNPSISREEAEAKALASWVKDAEPWARRVREKARATWKYLTDLSKWTTRSYLQMGGGEEPVKVVVPEDEHLTLEGFKMVFRGFDESPYKDKLEPLKAGLHLYRERASRVLPLLLAKQLPMIVDWVFDPRDSGSGGAFYEQRYIRITPWFLTNDIKKFVEMAAHEMGHHLYKTVLGGDERKFWDAAIRGNYGDLDLREALSEVRSLGSGVSFYDKELALANPVLFLQLQTLMHDPAYKYMDVWDPDSAQRHLDRGGSPIFRVPQHPITGYAGRNTEEAFCEAVGRLVAYGPLVLPEEVRGWLRVVLPHIKISSDNAVLDSSAFAPFKVGDFITYGKFQNKPGKIERLFVDEHGIPSIEIAAVGHARRKNRIMGLFRIRHMDMAKRVASRWAGTLLQFPTRAAPVRPKHTVTLGGRKYALSSDGGPLGDQLEGLSGGDGGGAKVVDIPAFMKPEPYRFLWAYDTEDGSVSMWRVTDGNSKVWGSADTLASKIVELERKGELNRVTSAEMAKLDRTMRKKEHEQLQSMKKWLAENATEYQTFVDAVAWDVFNREVRPKVDKRLQEAKRGVVPFDFKVDESQLDYRSRGDQLRSHILTEEMAVFTVGAIEDEVKSRGVDPDAPDHDIQAAYWAMNDVVQAVWEKYSRFKIASDPLVSALRVVDAYLVEARRRWDDDETYLQWVQDALEPLAQAVRRVDALWTDRPSRPATSDLEYVRDMLEGGRWIFYMADGGYSRLVLHGPGDPGPTMHFEVGLASLRTLPKWNRLVEQGLATKGGHLKVGSSPTWVGPYAQKVAALGEAVRALETIVKRDGLSGVDSFVSKGVSAYEKAEDALVQYNGRMPASKHEGAFDEHDLASVLEALSELGYVVRERGRWFEDLREDELSRLLWVAGTAAMDMQSRVRGAMSKVGYIKEPPFSPRQDLAQGFKFRVKSDSIGIVVRVYQGTTRVGGVVANWISRADSCAEDEAALRAQYPVLEKARVLYVWKAHLSDEVHNRGLGRAMYQAVMAAGFKYQGGPFLFTNTECWIGSGTSAMAKRVWASLARQYPSSGDMVAVLRPPTIASRDLDPEQESKVGGSMHRDIDMLKVAEIASWVRAQTVPRFADHAADILADELVRERVAEQVTVHEGSLVTAHGEVPHSWVEVEGHLLDITACDARPDAYVSQRWTRLGAFGQDTSDGGSIRWSGMGDDIPWLLGGEGVYHRFSSRTAEGKYKEKKEVPKADGKGTTTVYVYSEKQVEHRHREKAKRYEGLSKDIDKLRKQVTKDIDAEDPKTRLTALAVGLIDATFERVGNESSADDGHFGVTGWLKKHLTFGKGTATIRYVGKSGVDHEKVVDDAKLVKALKGCCEDKKPGDPILSFGAEDSEGPVKVTSQDVNEYLKPFDVTAKDLRGFHANREMQEALRSVRKKGPKLPSDKKEKEKLLKDEFKEALEATAEAVGHEAATLRTQYLVPGLQDAYEKDGTVMDKLKDASAHRVASRWVQATKSDAEREDEEVERLSRPVPKKKPSRDDSKRERIDIEAPEKPDKDLSMNYKDTGG